MNSPWMKNPKYSIKKFCSYLSIFSLNLDYSSGVTFCYYDGLKLVSQAYGYCDLKTSNTKCVKRTVFTLLWASNRFLLRIIKYWKEGFEKTQYIFLHLFGYSYTQAWAGIAKDFFVTLWTITEARVSPTIEYSAPIDIACDSGRHKIKQIVCICINEQSK